MSGLVWLAGLVVTAPLGLYRQLLRWVLPTSDSSVTGVMANICPAHKSVTILLSIFPQKLC